MIACPASMSIIEPSRPCVLASVAAETSSMCLRSDFTVVFIAFPEDAVIVTEPDLGKHDRVPPMTDRKGYLLERWTSTHMQLYPVGYTWGLDT